jgi:hypothetical protein
VTPPAHIGLDSLLTLEQRIAQLVRLRQELRDLRAERELLETNRLDLVRAQQALSNALIARHLRPAA